VVQGILKNSSAAFAFQMINRALGFFCFIGIARLMGIEKTGYFTYLLSQCALLALFVEFGTNMFLVRKVAANKGNGPVSDIVGVIALKIVQFLIGIVILFWLEFDEIVNHFNILSVLFLYVLFESIGQTGISVLNGKMRFINANKYVFAYESGRSLLLITLIYLFDSEVVIPFVYIISSILFAFFIFMNVLRPNLHIRQLEFRGILNSMFSCYSNTYLFFVAAIAFQLYFRMDMILLKKLSSEYELGVYGTAYKFFEVFLFIPAIVSGILFPNIVELLAKGKSELVRYLSDFQLKTAVLIAIPVGILILSSGLIIDIFFGSSFAGSSSIMQILFLTSFLYCFNFVYPVLMNAGGLERFSLYCYVVGLALNLFLNYLWIPDYGAKGAAYATLCSEFVVTLLFILFAYFKGLGFVNPYAGLLIAGSIGLSIAGFTYVVVPVLILSVLYIHRTSLNLKQILHVR
jgi:O-antigen/teichoic acid export membrane protein